MDKYGIFVADNESATHLLTINELPDNIDETLESFQKIVMKNFPDKFMIYVDGETIADDEESRGQFYDLSAIGLVNSIASSRIHEETTEEELALELLEAYVESYGEFDESLPELAEKIVQDINS